MRAFFGMLNSGFSHPGEFAASELSLADCTKIADIYDVGADIRSGVWKVGFAK
jgi:hypothetical protein